MVDASKVQEAEVVEQAPPEFNEENKLDALAQIVGKLNVRLDELEKDQEQLNKNQQKLVEHVNGWIQSIEGIDQTAFMATYTHVNGGLTEAITKDKVKATHKFLEDAFKKLNTYRDEIMKEVEENRKKVEKKIKADAKKKTVKKATKKNVGNQHGNRKSKSK